MSIQAETISHDSRALPPATRIVRLAGDHGNGEFRLRRGGVLHEVHIGYESWGSLTVDKDNAVLLFTGLSPSAHAASSEADPTPGWWEYMIGPGKPIDTNRFFVICVNSLGSCFGSTNPFSINPKTMRPYCLDFPEITIEDIAKAGYQTIQALGIECLLAVVGPSMGGMSSLAYALQYPDQVGYLISISGAAHALPFTIAVRSLQREIIRCDPNWENGCYEADREPLQGMLLARKLGMMSYRAAQEWHQRFDRAKIPAQRQTGKPFGIEFEVESYLDYNARKFVGTFDANSYLYLSRAMDLFDVADHGGSVDAGLARIQAKRSLIIGVTTDILFPVEQQVEIAEGLDRAGRQVDYVSLSSINGHDSFLIDAEHFAPKVRQFFDRDM